MAARPKKNDSPAFESARREIRDCYDRFLGTTDPVAKQAGGDALLRSIFGESATPPLPSA